MRLFVAIELDENLKSKVEEIENQIRKCGCDVKFVEPENLHFTLKFLGEVPEQDVKGIKDKISASVKGMKQFKLSLEGFGYFGKPDYIRSLWIDVGEGKDELVKLIENMNQNLDDIRREVHGANPHLTIGRVKSGRGRQALLETINSLKDVKLGEMLVKFVKLKQSTLTKKGPIYSDLKIFELV
jgi:2'-5' RNA ligase